MSALSNGQLNIRTLEVNGHSHTHGRAHSMENVILNKEYIIIQGSSPIVNLLGKMVYVEVMELKIMHKSLLLNATCSALWRNVSQNGNLEFVVGLSWAPMY